MVVEKRTGGENLLLYNVGRQEKANVNMISLEGAVGYVCGGVEPIGMQSENCREY